MKLVRQMEPQSYGDRLTKLKLSRLEKRRLHGHFMATFQYLKGTYREAKRVSASGTVVIGKAVMTSRERGEI